MTSRVAVSPETLKRLRGFTNGLDAKSADEAINFVLDSLLFSNETPILAGLRLRERFDKWRGRGQYKS